MLSLWTTHDQKKMICKVYHRTLFLFIIFLSQNICCLSENPGIGILTESNVYIAQINEFNYTNDELYLIYHHNDPIYPLQSLTPNELVRRVYVCSPSTIYLLDLRLGFDNIIPLFPVDDTPCRSSLVYLSNETTLIWASHRSAFRLNLQQMLKEFLWNSTFTITDMIHNSTIDEERHTFYFGLQKRNREAIIAHCLTNRHLQMLPSQSCRFIDSGYREVSSLAIDRNRLYVADRIQHIIYALNLSPNGMVLSKELLPLNTSVIADIRSMFIYNNNNHCQNTHAQCIEWALAGECTNNPDFMRRACGPACQSCCPSRLPTTTTNHNNLFVDLDAMFHNIIVKLNSIQFQIK